jgi:uncharacterized integral membrane protein (TIGR00697 family)
MLNQFISDFNNEIIFICSFLFLGALILICLHLGKGYLYALMGMLAILINIYVVQSLEMFGMTTYGGNIIYGSMFLVSDVLAEHYDKKQALKGVKIGILALLVYLFFSLIFINTQPITSGAPLADIELSLKTSAAFKSIFTPAWGIVIASVTAFAISNILDVYVYDFLHKVSGKKLLWLRNNASTIISQLIDTLIFTSLAIFFGIMAWEFFWEIVLFAYVFKLIIALLDTPFLYLSYKFVRKDKR